MLAVTLAALAGAGVGAAAGFGAFNVRLSPFNGISAAQHTKTGANILPSGVLAQVKQMNTQARGAANAPSAKSPRPHFQLPMLLPGTARVIGTTPDGSKVYVLTDTRGELCVFGGPVDSCGRPLTRSHPITMGSSNGSPTGGGTLIVSGVAMDAVTSVSFRVWSKEVTVPVKDNVYLYEKPDSTATVARCVVAHFADGATVNAFPQGHEACGSS